MTRPDQVIFRPSPANKAGIDDFRLRQRAHLSLSTTCDVLIGIALDHLGKQQGAQMSKKQLVRPQAGETVFDIRRAIGNLATVARHADGDDHIECKQLVDELKPYARVILDAAAKIEDVLLANPQAYGELLADHHRDVNIAVWGAA